MGNLAIKNYIDKNKEEIINLWQRAINTDSGTYDLEGLGQVFAIFKEELEKTGFEVEEYKFENAGSTLFANYNSHIDKEPILFLGHMDTVFSTKESKKRPFKIEDGIAYGPGVLDMKPGVVIGIYVARALKEIGYEDRPIKFIISGDEEIAHVNSNSGSLIQEQAKGAFVCFNFESGRVDDSLVVARKGTRSFYVDIEGISVHSGNNPEDGRSAILEAAYKIIELEKLNDYSRGKLINCGLVSGGVSYNTVAGNARIDILTRYEDNSIGDEIVKDVEEVLNKTFVEGTKTSFEKKDGIPAMQASDKTMKLFELIRQTSNELGYGDLKAIKVGGGSDSSYTTAANVPTVCAMGVRGEFNHTPREYAVVDSIFERIDIAANTILKLDNIK